MRKTTKSSASARIAVAIAAFALVGAVGAGHAETDLDQSVETASFAGTQKASPVFTPSEEAQFAEAFAPFDTPAEPVARSEAVDITEIEPAQPAATSLGTGVASYYGRRFNGRLTANGERFDMMAMTAAHKTLPFGTRLRVTNTSNGQSVIVRINDRGPFIRGREIDLSRGAAEQIGMISRGHATVEIEKLDS